MKKENLKLPANRRSPDMLADSLQYCQLTTKFLSSNAKKNIYIYIYIYLYTHTRVGFSDSRATPNTHLAVCIATQPSVSRPRTRPW